MFLQFAAPGIFLGHGILLECIRVEFLLLASKDP